MESITFKEFKRRYAPIKKRTITEESKRYEEYLFNVSDDQEYIANKRYSYVWSVVLDREKKRLIGIPGKNLSNAEFVFITTKPFNDGTYEYIKLEKK